jgi:1-deoxy-D-xylulose-5-phosphate synthase
VPLDAGPPRALPWAKAELMIEDGDDLALIAAGPVAHEAVAAARQLAAQRVRCTVVNARFIKPLDEELLTRVIARATAVISVEESILAGGFGSALLELCEARGLHPRLRRLGVPDRWIPQGTIAEQRRACGLDAVGIVAAYRLLRDARPEQTVATDRIHH